MRDAGEEKNNPVDPPDFNVQAAIIPKSVAGE
jgi:hypothetical protein